MSWLPGSRPCYIPDVRLAPLSRPVAGDMEGGRSHGGTKAAVSACFPTCDPQESRRSRHLIWMMLTINTKVATLGWGREGGGQDGQVELETRGTQEGGGVSFPRRQDWA